VFKVAFSPDGRTVLTSNLLGNEVRLWNPTINPVPDDPARLHAWVAMRTRKAFDDRGVLRELTMDEWLRCSKDLDENGGDWDPLPDSRPWQRIQAAEAEAAGQWFAAVFHLKWLVTNDPNDEDLKCRLKTAEERLAQVKP
jgi:hypothetical protein